MILGGCYSCERVRNVECSHQRSVPTLSRRLPVAGGISASESLRDQCFIIVGGLRGPREVLKVGNKVRLRQETCSCLCIDGLMDGLDGLGSLLRP